MEMPGQGIEYEIGTDDFDFEPAVCWFLAIDATGHFKRLGNDEGLRKVRGRERRRAF